MQAVSHRCERSTDRKGKICTLQRASKWFLDIANSHQVKSLKKKKKGATPKTSLVVALVASRSNLVCIEDADLYANAR